MTTPQTQPRLYNFNRLYDPTGRTGTGAQRTARPFKPIYTVSPGVVGDEQAEQPAPQPPPRLYNFGKPDVQTSTQQRVYQPNSFVQANDDLQRLLTTPAEDENGRGRSGLNVGIYAASQAARETGSLPATLGALAGGALAGVFRPETDEKLQRPYKIQQAEMRAQAAAAADKEQREADLNQAEIGLKKATTRYYDYRPEAERQKADAQALARTQTALRAEIKNRLQNPRPFDPTDAYDSDLQQRASAAGVGFDPSGFGDTKNPFTIEAIDPTDPSGTRKTRLRYNRTAQEFEPVTVDDKPVATGYVQPVDPKTGMTPAQEHTDSDRDASRTETHRHNVVTEGQGTERIGIAHENAGRRGQPTAVNTNARLARAAELNRKLEEEKNKAAHPPTFNPATNQPMTPQQQAAYSARHKAQAAQYATQITSAYGDLYEAGQDGDGWAYAKPKVQPNSQPTQSGVYAGHRFSRSQLPEIRKRLGVSSDEEAERIVTSQGGVFY